MNDEDSYYIPEVPDLKVLNLSFVEWLEKVLETETDGSYMNQEHSFEEEEEHWTAIARNLDEQQLQELDKRIHDLRTIAGNMRAFQRKTESTYYTRKEQSKYVERRVSEGYGRWQAKKEAREGKLVPPRKGDSASALPESPTAPPK
jgi:hypothetical protein